MVLLFQDGTGTLTVSPGSRSARYGVDEWRAAEMSTCRPYSSDLRSRQDSARFSGVWHSCWLWDSSVWCCSGARMISVVEPEAIGKISAKIADGIVEDPFRFDLSLISPPA